MKIKRKLDEKGFGTMSIVIAVIVMAVISFGIIWIVTGTNPITKDKYVEITATVSPGWDNQYDHQTIDIDSIDTEITEHRIDPKVNRIFARQGNVYFEVIKDGEVLYKDSKQVNLSYTEQTKQVSMELGPLKDSGNYHIRVYTTDSEGNEDRTRTTTITI